jgi:mRNA-degrading endonuclease RelE of RelBE toxin-antitoxin system
MVRRPAAAKQSPWLPEKTANGGHRVHRLKLVESPKLVCHTLPLEFGRLRSVRGVDYRVIYRVDGLERAVAVVTTSRRSVAYRASG